MEVMICIYEVDAFWFIPWKSLSFMKTLFFNIRIRQGNYTQTYVANFFPFFVGSFRVTSVIVRAVDWPRDRYITLETSWHQISVRFQECSCLTHQIQSVRVSLVYSWAWNTECPESHNSKPKKASIQREVLYCLISVLFLVMDDQSPEIHVRSLYRLQEARIFAPDLTFCWFENFGHTIRND